MEKNSNNSDIRKFYKRNRIHIYIHVYETLILVTSIRSTESRKVKIFFEKKLPTDGLSFRKIFLRNSKRGYLFIIIYVECATVLPIT